MNALVTFRANAAGTLTPTAAQRKAAVDAVTANLRAKLAGLLRGAAA